jgi:hypothetical protein
MESRPSRWVHDQDGPDVRHRGGTPWYVAQIPRRWHSCNAAACPALSAPDPPMIRTDRELLADLARLNSDVVPLAMQIIDDIATREEQQIFAERLIELGTRLSHRARHTAIVIDSDNATDGAEYARREP